MLDFCSDYRGHVDSRQSECKLTASAFNSTLLFLDFTYVFTNIPCTHVKDAK